MATSAESIRSGVFGRGADPEIRRPSRPLRKEEGQTECQSGFSAALNRPSRSSLCGFASTHYGGEGVAQTLLMPFPRKRLVVAPVLPPVPGRGRRVAFLAEGIDGDDPVAARHLARVR